MVIGSKLVLIYYPIPVASRGAHTSSFPWWWTNRREGREGGLTVCDRTWRSPRIFPKRSHSGETVPGGGNFANSNRRYIAPRSRPHVRRSGSCFCISDLTFPFLSDVNEESSPKANKNIPGPIAHADMQMAAAVFPPDLRRADRPDPFPNPCKIINQPDHNPELKYFVR